MSEQLTLYVDEETAELVKSMRSESEQRAGMWDMSKSEAAVLLLEHGIEEIGEDPELEELIDDLELRIWRNNRRHEKRKREAEFAEKSGGWRGRVRDRMNRRLSGPEPYPPEKMEDLCESYYGDIEDWELDRDRLPEHREWLDERISMYRDAYQSKEVVPEETFTEVDQVETGAELLRLRDCFGEVVEQLIEHSVGDQYDPDAILRTVARDYGVAEETIELILEQLIPEDVSPRRALSQGEGISESIDRDALEDWGADPELEKIEDTQAVYESGEVSEEISSESPPEKSVTVTRSVELPPTREEIELDPDAIEELREMRGSASTAELDLRAHELADSDREAEMLLEELDPTDAGSKQEAPSDD